MNRWQSIAARTGAPAIQAIAMALVSGVTPGLSRPDRLPFHQRADHGGGRQLTIPRIGSAINLANQEQEGMTQRRVQGVA